MKTFSPQDYHKSPRYLAIAGLWPDRLSKRYGFGGEKYLEIVFKGVLTYNWRKAVEQSVVPQA
ncbi:hypothetical protein [Duganella qianjiadongensis]|uniref:Uncharacterized protein n=1 Tax=Duganella qianjiadongensis TaxID=2692176 RepID=A0ABW9VNU5_9BURK|nr:hypothetical protein [Duganella qianjiadongensis]MYM40119.1 hypothetical protein [Duganella qianjiadongensis]